MSELILNKQKEHKTGIERRSIPSITKIQLALVKIAMLFGVFAVFITLSIYNNNLFLKELLVCAGIIGLLCFVHIRSQSEQ